MELSDKFIQLIEPPDRGRKTISDEHRDAPRGFAVRVYSTGTRVFVLRYTADRRDRVLTIGEYPTWTLAAARRRATEVRREVDAGHDILAERAQRQEEATVRDVAAAFLKSKLGFKSYNAIERSLSRFVVSEAGDWKIADLRRRHAIAMVESAEAHGARQASLALTYMKQMFAWAEDRELVEANPVATLKPGKISKSLSPRHRSRILSDEEIRDFWQHIESCGPRRLTALALKFVLVTGQRPGEVAGMRRQEVDGDLWTIPGERRGKTETDQLVPLTGAALGLLDAAAEETERLNQRKGRTGEFVFEAIPGNHLTVSAMGRAVIRHADAIGNLRHKVWGNWRPHDLRRTMRTGLAALGVDEVTAEAAIGHTRKGIAAVYDVHGYGEEKRAALEAWETKLLEMLNRDTRCGP